MKRRPALWTAAPQCVPFPSLLLCPPGVLRPPSPSSFSAFLRRALRRLSASTKLQPRQAGEGRIGHREGRKGRKEGEGGGEDPAARRPPSLLGVFVSRRRWKGWRKIPHGRPMWCSSLFPPLRPLQVNPPCMNCLFVYDRVACDHFRQFVAERQFRRQWLDFERQGTARGERHAVLEFTGLLIRHSFGSEVHSSCIHDARMKPSKPPAEHGEDLCNLCAH
jgi:hypothetical protein